MNALFRTPVNPYGPVLCGYDQVAEAVPVQITGGNSLAARGPDLDLKVFTPALGGTVVDVGVYSGHGYTVVEAPDDQIFVAVTVQIAEGSGNSPFGDELGLPKFSEWISNYVSRDPLQVGLAVAEDQVEVPVLVQIELVDTLQHTCTRDVQVLSCVAEGTLAKIFESLCFKGVLSHDAPRCLQDRRLIKSPEVSSARFIISPGTGS